MLTNEDARRKLENERIEKEMAYRGYRKVRCPECGEKVRKGDRMNFCICCGGEGFLWKEKDE